jgi:arylsulfatase A-like enzyme
MLRGAAACCLAPGRHPAGRGTPAAHDDGRRLPDPEPMSQTAAALLFLAAAAALLACCTAASAVAGSQANLVHVVVDDLGFFDVGYKDPEVLSPHLDALREEGVELARFYSAKWCAPARSSMQTGRYAWRNGYYSTQASEAVPLSVPLLPEVLRRAGYRCHAVGKWHLGYRLKEYTPTFRGYDSFLGYYNSMEDYWTHYGPSPATWPDWPANPPANRGACSGIDLTNATGYKIADGIRIAPGRLNGTYSSEMYSARTVEIIADHATSSTRSKENGGEGAPLYLYLPYQSVHMPNEAPAEAIDRYPPINNAARRSYLGMIAAFDDALGIVTTALKQHRLWANTVLILNGDNGGPVWCSGMNDCPHAEAAMYGPVSNYPLRSGKWSNWDGGFRVNAFISSPLLPAARRNTSWDGMMHITDIWATFATLAHLQPSVNEGTDSIDMWSAILSGGPSPRKEIAHTITNSWNVVNGVKPCNACVGTERPGKSCTNASAAEPFEPLGPGTKQYSGCGGALQVGHLKLLVGYPGDTTLYGPPASSAGSGHDGQVDLNALPLFPCQKHCLFNTTADPSETKDLSADVAFASDLAHLLARYEQLSKQGRAVLTYAGMIEETGAVCVSSGVGANDSCAVAKRFGVVEPCGFIE